MSESDAERCACGGEIASVKVVKSSTTPTPGTERVQVCGDCGTVYRDGDTETNSYECENGHTWKGSAAVCCPQCQTGRVYILTEVGDRVPV